jgi:hypothetical protein
MESHKADLRRWQGGKDRRKEKKELLKHGLDLFLDVATSQKKTKKKKKNDYLPRQGLFHRHSRMQRPSRFNQTLMIGFGHVRRWGNKTKLDKSLRREGRKKES